MNVVDLPMAQDTRAQDLANGVALIQRWRRILAVRWLASAALAGAVVNWTVTIADPGLWRFVSAAGYSVGVLVPVLVLYFLTARGD